MFRWSLLLQKEEYYVNTKLRDYYQNLDLLCEDLQISKEYLEAKLDAIDFEYDAERNQFV